MTSLSEENIVLRSGLEIFAAELETLRVECARLRAERDAHQRNSQEAISRMWKAQQKTASTSATAPPRFVFENHVVAEKTKGTDCPILMSPLSDCGSVTVSTTCGHIFDTAAFKVWNKDHKECPVCRVCVGSTHVF